MSAATPNPDPLTRRLLQGVKLLSLLLILVVVNSFVNGGEASLNPLAAAAERTQEQPGARFAMRATYSSSALPQPAVANGHGAYNSETGLSEATLTVNSPKTGRVTIESVGDDTAFYLRGSEISAELPGGKEWMKVEPFLGHSQEEAMLSGSGAESSFDALSSTGGSVTRLGSEKVHGVETQRYRAEVSFGEYADLLREEGKDEIADQYEKYGTLMPSPPLVEGWVDGKGILRRTRMVMTMPAAPGQPTVTMDMRMELFDLGARPEVVLPDPSRVFDATPLLREQLDSIETS